MPGVVPDGPGNLPNSPEKIPQSAKPTVPLGGGMVLYVAVITASDAGIVKVVVMSETEANPAVSPTHRSKI